MWMEPWRSRGGTNDSNKQSSSSTNHTWIPAPACDTCTAQKPSHLAVRPAFRTPHASHSVRQRKPANVSEIRSRQKPPVRLAKVHLEPKKSTPHFPHHTHTTKLLRRCNCRIGDGNHLDKVSSMKPASMPHSEAASKRQLV